MKKAVVKTDKKKITVFFKEYCSDSDSKFISNVILQPLIVYLLFEIYKKYLEFVDEDLKVIFSSYHFGEFVHIYKLYEFLRDNDLDVKDLKLDKVYPLDEEITEYLKSIKFEKMSIYNPKSGFHTLFLYLAKKLGIEDYKSRENKIIFDLRNFIVEKFKVKVKDIDEFPFIAIDFCRLGKIYFSLKNEKFFQKIKEKYYFYLTKDADELSLLFDENLILSDREKNLFIVLTKDNYYCFEVYCENLKVALSIIGKVVFNKKIFYEVEVLEDVCSLA